jgi:hypothetical protein
MEQVGYQLIADDGTIVESWGGVWGQCPAEPNPIYCPNGDVVYAPAINVDYNGYKLVPWMMEKPPTPVPQQVPMWAVRTVLQNDNLFTEAQAAIDASTDNALKNVWEYGNFADRGSKAIASLAATLNLTDAQVDQMFIDANSLEV